MALSTSDRVSQFGIYLDSLDDKGVYGIARLYSGLSTNAFGTALASLDNAAADAADALIFRHATVRGKLSEIDSSFPDLRVAWVAAVRDGAYACASKSERHVPWVQQALWPFVVAGFRFHEEA